MKRLDLKKIRKERNLTQAALAEKLGVQQSFVSQAENGHDSIPGDWITKLGDLFGDIKWGDYMIDEPDPAENAGCDNSALFASVIKIFERELAAKNEHIASLMALLERNISKQQ